VVFGAAVDVLWEEIDAVIRIIRSTRSGTVAVTVAVSSDDIRYVHFLEEWQLWTIAATATLQFG
jgi:hypothetical protein